jgi:adenosylcobinamide-GDP ribazoletransferase
LIAVLRGLPRDLVTSLRFLTRLPIPGSPPLCGPGESLAAFPLAGLVLGLLVAVLDALLGQLRLPFFTRDVLAVLALVLLTGGLHLDGLMDTCDGLWGGHTPERRLEIMRDSRVGGYGVLAGAGVLLLKLAALAALPLHQRTAALIVAPALGRWVLVLAAALFPPARPDGLGAAFRRAVAPARLTIAMASGLAIVAVAGGGSGLTAWLACSTVTWLAGRAMLRKIPGLTGDTYGALAELAEVVALFAFAPAV